ncbi:MAG: GspE/PulE family protein [Candidatus Komeilibacteria bacterium]
MTEDKKPQLHISSDEKAEELASKLANIKADEQEDEIKQRAQRSGLSYINLRDYPIDPEALALLEESEARKLPLLCFFYDGKKLRLASTDPQNKAVQNASQALAKEQHAEYELYLVSKTSFDKGMEVYARVPKQQEISTGVKIDADELTKLQDSIQDKKDLQNKLNTANTSQIVTLIIASALRFDTSDIHVEAEEKSVKLRLRIDGELTTMAAMNKSDWPKITARVKLLSGLKLNLTTAPQDGRFTIFLPDDKIDVRVSTMPTSYGESIVMRLLKSSSVGLKFEQLGLRGRSFQDMEENINRPNGMIVTTGPTGSGKTTTLYAILNKLNNENSKIITLEDPVEYKLAGINQSQIDPSKGYTFASGLRSILRQDPDIVMVGEIRDLETAEVAINAALTGHLMISTLHTNSAAGAIPRFLAMGVKPFLLAPAINAFIGQRLVRKLCEHCKQEYKPDDDTLQKVKDELSNISPQSGDALSTEELDKLKFYKAVGCDKCHAGYKGRIGVYEVLTMNTDIEKMVMSGKVSEEEAQNIAIQHGMVTMIQDGLLKAKDGITSLEEVFDKTE